MPHMLKSRAVREGTIVSVRGNKYIRCSSRARPAGIWTGGGERLTRTLDGKVIRTVLPGGIVVRGVMDVRALAPRDEEAPDAEA